MILICGRLLKAKEPLDAEKHKSRRQLLMEGSIKAGFLAGEEEDDMWALCSGRFTQGLLLTVFPTDTN